MCQVPVWFSKRESERDREIERGRRERGRRERGLRCLSIEHLRTADTCKREREAYLQDREG